MAAWCRWEFPSGVLSAEEVEEEKRMEERDKVELPEGANKELWDSVFVGIGKMKEKWFDRSTMHSEFLSFHFILE